MAEDGYCAGDSGRSCEEDFCYCQINQITDPTSQCMTEPNQDAIHTPSESGWCYIDQAIHAEPAQQDVLAELGCTGSTPRVLRIVGEKKAGAVTLVACSLGR